MPGIPGTPGIPGRDGKDSHDGEKGDQGMLGNTRPPGTSWPYRCNRQEPGAPGPKGESGSSGMLAIRNWTECAWKNLDDDRD